MDERFDLVGVFLVPCVAGLLAVWHGWPIWCQERCPWVSEICQWDPG